jgi:hypothetical protein
LLRRNVCIQANRILASCILQVMEQPVSSWGPLDSGFASSSQPCSETCPCYVLLVNSLSLELGASQLACCRARCFSAERRPLGPKFPTSCKITNPEPRQELSQVKRSREVQVVFSKCGSVRPAQRVIASVSVCVSTERVTVKRHHGGRWSLITKTQSSVEKRMGNAKPGGVQDTERAQIRVWDESNSSHPSLKAKKGLCG